MGQDTRELWSKRVERWKDSGLSAREFASEMGINAQTLSYWRWKLGKKATKAPSKRRPTAFVEVVAEPAVELAPRVVERDQREERPEPLEIVLRDELRIQREERPEPLEIVLRDELRIRVPVHFDAEALRRVVATLGTC
jgi:transposase-like protein